MNKLDKQDEINRILEGESILGDEYNLLMKIIASSSTNLTKEDFDMLLDYYLDFSNFLNEIVSLPKNTNFLDNLILSLIPRDH